MIGSNGFFIFSGELASKDSTTNEIATSLVIANLKRLDVPYKLVIGAYRYDNGTIQRETSFVVPARYESVVLSLSKAAQQESVLYVSETAQATLFYTDGRVRKLGKFLSTECPRGLDSFTFDPYTNLYWYAK